VRLIHSTLQRYLSPNPDIFDRPHSEMAEICLAYLKSHQVKAIPPDTTPRALDPSFLEYCTMYKNVHMKKGLLGYAKSHAGGQLVIAIWFFICVILYSHDYYIVNHQRSLQIYHSTLPGAEEYSPPWLEYAGRIPEDVLISLAPCELSKKLGRLSNKLIEIERGERGERGKEEERGKERREG